MSAHPLLLSTHPACGMRGEYFTIKRFLHAVADLRSVTFTKLPNTTRPACRGRVDREEFLLLVRRYGDVYKNHFFCDMKQLCLLTISLIFGLISISYAQDVTLTPKANACIIQDSTLTSKDVFKHLIQNGYLVKYISDAVIETEYKSFKRNNWYISLLFNFIDGKIYVRSTMRVFAYPEGDETFQIRNTYPYKEEFMHMYNLLKQIKPQVVVEAVVL